MKTKIIFSIIMVVIVSIATIGWILEAIPEKIVAIPLIIVCEAFIVFGFILSIKIDKKAMVLKDKS